MGVKAPLTWAWASLVANIGIVLTGGLVRLTGSGLGCPRWPKCTDDSWTTHQALGIHGAIEFGNRLLTYVLLAVAIGTVISVVVSFVKRAGATASSLVLSVLLFLGIPLQAVIGGITVRTDLNPWIVSLHLVLSMGLIAGSAVLIDQLAARVRPPTSVASRVAVTVAAILTAAVVYLGTIVTGSGPHAGDAKAPRNELDPELFSHVHAFTAYGLLATTLLCVVVLHGAARRAAVGLLMIEAIQSGVGIAQFNLGLPVLLVGIHLVGAALLVAAAATMTVRALVSR